MQAIEQWFATREIRRVECLVPDLTGNARGKRVPPRQLSAGTELRFPQVGLIQSVAGECRQDLVSETDPDMLLAPDWRTLTVQPWASEPTAQLICDCTDEQGTPIASAPRNVLRRVLERYAARGLTPVVAPEMEFYLVARAQDGHGVPAAPHGRSGTHETQRSPYGVDAADEFSAVLDDLYRFCEVQGIGAAALLHEVGRGQLEINLDHGDALALADQVFLFKRSAREAARRHGLTATFMAKPLAGEAGSAMHIHQSLLDSKGNNVFSTTSGAASQTFFHFIGGLQRYLPSALVLFAPYVNSYRRLAPFSAAPINVEWGLDNRTCGLRVPNSAPAARRVENRLPGVDANPYLALAASLACGLLGIEQELNPTPPLAGSAYGRPYAFARTLDDAVAALEREDALTELLGPGFVECYGALKRAESEAFARIVTPWETQTLLEHV